MCVQIKRSSVASNQCSATDRLDQMVVGQLLNKHWKNGSRVSKYRQNPCKSLMTYTYVLIIEPSLVIFSLEQLLNNWLLTRFATEHRQCHPSQTLEVTPHLCNM